jgi:hypothetical protein
MEGRTKTGDIDNICGGRFGGLLFCPGSLAMLAAILRASSLQISLPLMDECAFLIQVNAC